MPKLLSGGKIKPILIFVASELVGTESMLMGTVM